MQVKLWVTFRKPHARAGLSSSNSNMSEHLVAQQQESLQVLGEEKDYQDMALNSWTQRFGRETLSPIGPFM